MCRQKKSTTKYMRHRQFALWAILSHNSIIYCRLTCATRLKRIYCITLLQRIRSIKLNKKFILTCHFTHHIIFTWHCFAVCCRLQALVYLAHSWFRLRAVANHDHVFVFFSCILHFYSYGHCY